MSDDFLCKLEQLEQRVRELEDKLAVAETLARYNRAVNYRSDLNPILTEDAVVEVVTPEGRTLGRHEGRGAYASYRATLPVPPERWAKNMALEQLIAITGDEAEVDSYYLVVADDGGVSRVAHYGRAVTRLLRGPHGWVIAGRRAEEESPAGRSRE